MTIDAFIDWISKTNFQASIISAFVSAGFSWGAYYLSSKEAKKKQQAVLIEEIVGLAETHWCSSAADSNNHHRAIEIQKKIKTLGWRINIENDESIENAYIAFRQSITDGNFAETNREPLLFEDTRIVLINRKFPSPNLRHKSQTLPVWNNLTGLPPVRDLRTETSQT